MRVEMRMFFMSFRSVFRWLYIAAIIGIYAFMMVSKTSGNRSQKQIAYSVAP